MFYPIKGANNNPVVEPGGNCHVQGVVSCTNLYPFHKTKWYFTSKKLESPLSIKGLGIIEQ